MKNLDNSSSSSSPIYYFYYYYYHHHHYFQLTVAEACSHQRHTPVETYKLCGWKVKVVTWFSLRSRAKGNLHVCRLLWARPALFGGKSHGQRNEVRFWKRRNKPNTLKTNTVKFRKWAPGLIFFKGPFWGANFWRGLYSEELIYGEKFAFQNRLG